MMVVVDDGDVWCFDVDDGHAGGDYGDDGGHGGGDDGENDGGG